MKKPSQFPAILLVIMICVGIFAAPGKISSVYDVAKLISAALCIIGLIYSYKKGRANSNNAASAQPSQETIEQLDQLAKTQPELYAEVRKQYKDGKPINAINILRESTGNTMHLKDAKALVDAIPVYEGDADTDGAENQTTDNEAYGSISEAFNADINKREQADEGHGASSVIQESNKRKRRAKRDDAYEPEQDSPFS